MSQQQLFPEPQSNRTHSEDEAEQPVQPYYWSTRPETGGQPKDEPLSTYDEPIAQPDYQEYTPSAAQQQGQQQSYHPDGDAYETGYRGYAGPRMQQQAPLWGQPQPRPQRVNPMALAFLVLVVLVLINIAFFVTGEFHGSFFFLIIPLLFLLRFWRGGRRRSRRGGPWPWMW